MPWSKKALLDAGTTRADPLPDGSLHIVARGANLWRDRRIGVDLVAFRLRLSSAKRLMPNKAKTAEADQIRDEWPLPSSVTLGSAIRSKGIERELRRKMVWALRKHLMVEAGRIVVSVPRSDIDTLQAISGLVDRHVASLAGLLILPREIEDILSISACERHKWVADGRLQSADTRTVKLRGRAKKVTFHVFDPRHVEDVLNADLPEVWREDDA